MRDEARLECGKATAGISAKEPARQSEREIERGKDQHKERHVTSSDKARDKARYVNGINVTARASSRLTFGYKANLRELGLTTQTRDLAILVSYTLGAVLLAR